MSNSEKPSTSSSSCEESKEPDKFVTLAVVKELLQVQERMSRSFTETLTTNITQRIYGLVAQVADLKASLIRPK